MTITKEKKKGGGGGGGVKTQLKSTEKTWKLEIDFNYNDISCSM